MLSVCIRSWPNVDTFDGYGRDVDQAGAKFELDAARNGRVLMGEIFGQVFSVRVNVIGFGRLKFFVL